MKSAASSNYQPKGVWEGRAAHVTAKATDSNLESEWLLDLPGVWDAGRDDSSVRNRRDPPRRPTSGEDRVYKVMPKALGAGRESEGLIVPVKADKTSRWREGALLWSRVR